MNVFHVEIVGRDSIRDGILGKYLRLFHCVSVEQLD
jgi:hypothetical protein